ncbi:hypothetical protein [Phaeodactylibacter luteus]|uniref:Uncharacterized protein n=1 Tax=Phaeodactylibacter luteus TaxID=1564516 RepID=A0A5C6RGI5_9BACT|nr:hypothetical protein [Phaeodactylibacter luteus]TXB59440.1 hypothetical protein FRY97_21160 [Phaeodactylibacter luteus]
MKQIIFYLVLLQSSILFGQTTSSSEIKDSSNIYNIALRVYLSDAVISDELFVEKNDITTSSMPEQLGGVTIQLMNIRQIRKKAKKGPFTLYRIIPLRFEEGIFFVNVIPFNVKCKRKNLQMANQGGVTVKFKYNCETNTLSVLN